LSSQKLIKFCLIWVVVNKGGKMILLNLVLLGKNNKPDQQQEDQQLEKQS